MAVLEYDQSVLSSRPKIHINSTDISNRGNQQAFTQRLTSEKNLAQIDQEPKPTENLQKKARVGSSADFNKKTPIS